MQHDCPTCQCKQVPVVTTKPTEFDYRQLAKARLELILPSVAARLPRE